MCFLHKIKTDIWDIYIHENTFLNYQYCLFTFDNLMPSHLKTYESKYRMYIELNIQVSYRFIKKVYFLNSWYEIYLYFISKIIVTFLKKCTRLSSPLYQWRLSITNSNSHWISGAESRAQFLLTHNLLYISQLAALPLAPAAGGELSASAEWKPAFGGQ